MAVSRAFIEAVLLHVDNIDAGRAAQPRRLGGHDAYRTGAENQHGFAAVHLAPVNGRVAGGEDVGQEQGLVVGEGIRDFAGAVVGVGHAHVLGLAAVVAAIEVGVAEQGAALLAHQAALGAVVLGVGVLAVAGQSVVAEEAGAAGNREGHHHPVAYFQIAHALADFLHDAHELVAEHHRAGLGQEAVVEVQVGAADGRAGDADNGVAAVFNRGVIHRVDANVADAVNL